MLDLNEGFDPIDGLDLDVGNQPDPNAAAPTSEEKMAAMEAELAELRGIASDPAIAELRKNPNLLADARAALLRQPEPQPRYEPGPTPEQLAQQDLDANQEFLKNPARYTVQAALAAARKAQMESQGPVQEHLAGLTIENFKARKEATDPDYKFAKEDLEKAEPELIKGLAGQPVSVQNRILENQYYAAIGRRYASRQRIAPKTSKAGGDPPNLGRGTGSPGGGSGAGDEDTVSTGALEYYKHLGYNDEDAKQMLKYAEESDVYVR